MEEVEFSSWEKLDIRVGKILKVEDIDGADKLYNLEVDIGEDKPRTLVAGLKKHYSKKKLVGKSCVVFCNLERKKLKGIESRGMVLAAVNDDDKIMLIQPEDEIEAGSKIR